MPFDYKNAPSLRFTNMEIQPYENKGGQKNNIIPLKEKPQSKLKLKDKHQLTPHLCTQSDTEKRLLERNHPRIYPFDSWARIKWSAYALPTSPTEIHQVSLTHAVYTDPLPGRLPPLIYK
ncbi:hypothetical protein SprV_0401679600 [Sparganum proliferum]